MLLLEAQAGGAASFFASPIFMIILMFVIMYFFMIRPQRKQQKAIEAFRNSLSAGQQRFIDTATAAAIMEEFFNTPFEGGRHQARIDKIPVQ